MTEKNGIKASLHALLVEVITVYNMIEDEITGGITNGF
jgi:hypothetical protein